MTILGLFLPMKPAYLSTYQVVISTYRDPDTCKYADFCVSLQYNS